MELTQRELIKIRLLELSGLTDDNVDEIYKELYHKWLFFNSDEVCLDGKLLSKSEKRLMAVAGFKSIDGELKFSSTKKNNGLTLPEKNFINNYIERYSLLINEIPPNEVLLKNRISVMLEYLENKIKLFTPNNPTPEKHNYPVIDKTIISNTDWIYNTFVNKVFTGSKECFDAWLVNGYTHPEPLTWTLTSRKNKPNYAQLRLFVNIITNTDTCKDAYFKKVWGIEIKTAQIKPSVSFDKNLEELDQYFRTKTAQ